MLHKPVHFFITAWLVALVSPALAEKASVPESINGTTRVSAEEVIELISGNADTVIIDARNGQ